MTGSKIGGYYEDDTVTKSKRMPNRWPVFLLQWVLVLLIWDQIHDGLWSRLYANFGDTGLIGDAVMVSLSAIAVSSLEYWVLSRYIVGLPRYWILVSFFARIIFYIGNHIIGLFLTPVLLPSDAWLVYTIPFNLVSYVGPAILQVGILQRYVRYAWLWVLGNFGVLMFWAMAIERSSPLSYRRTDNPDLSAFIIGLGIHLITGLTLILIVKLTQHTQKQMAVKRST